MSVAESTRRCGIDRKRLWYVLNGQREMRVDEFLKLCIALKLDPRSFVTREMVEEVAEATRRSAGVRERREMVALVSFAEHEETADTATCSRSFWCSSWSRNRSARPWKRYRGRNPNRSRWSRKWKRWCALQK